MEPEALIVFVPREKLRQWPEVHVAGLCIDVANPKKPRILLARRNSTRALFPNKLEGCGGQLARSEGFVAGVERHFRLEMQLPVRVLEDLHIFYEIPEEEDHPLIPGIRFLCERLDSAEPQSANHSELRWYTEPEFKRLAVEEFVGNLKQEAVQLLKRWRERA